MKTEKDILKEVLDALKGIKRCEYRVCDDGDGYVDAWEDESSDGPYVLHTSILNIIALAEEELADI